MTGDARYMQRALDAAALGANTARPNPMVGAVIVRDGQIVGVGHHERAGGPHAEVVALQQAGEQARGADIYVNLEPCSHFGRTPPCADALVRAGVARVFAGMIDPNPRVSGAGIQRLRDAGIETHVGMLEDACRDLNRDFIVHILHRRPMVTLKMATSLDGRIADSTGSSQWITGPEARAAGHALRAQSDAILVGTTTVLRDNPSLTVRDAEQVRPLHRWALDRHLRTPDGAALLDTSAAPTTLVVGPGVDTARRVELEALGVEILEAPLVGTRIDLPWVLANMGQRGWLRLLVEGGGVLAGALLEADRVDRIELFVAPIVLGDRGAPAFVTANAPGLAAITRHGIVRTQTLGADVQITVDVRRA